MIGVEGKEGCSETVELWITISCKITGVNAICLMAQEIRLVYNCIKNTSTGGEEPFPLSRDRVVGVSAAAGEPSSNKEVHHSKASSTKGSRKDFFS